MRTLIRRTPVEVPQFSSLLNHVFSDPFFGGVATITDDEGTLAIDVSEDDQHVFVRASLPGFAKEDVSIEVHDSVLSIRAERSEEKEEKNEKFYRRERRFGSMSRSVALPSPVREGEATAELKDGVLTVQIPRVAEKTPKRIAIN